MIKLKTMKWSNAFSYGSNNVIDFSLQPLTQLVGKNGHGKSSIALILEEVLYNKNSKGVKKANILNRYASSNSYSIELDFSKYNDEYKIKTTRGSTQTVKLLKNGEDISAHTSTNTYKLIEEIIGFDHKTFSQIVYQSNPFSLEFLTATDTTRKKFLIDLLNLSKYTKAYDIFKVASKEVSDELSGIQVKHKSIVSLITKYSAMSLESLDPVEVPPAPTSKISLLVELKDKLNNITQLNKKINQNNTYIKLLDSISIDPIPQPEDKTSEYLIAKSKVENKLIELRKTVKGVGNISDKCSVCGQPIDNSHKLIMAKEAAALIPTYEEEFLEINKLLSNNRIEIDKYNTYLKNQQEWEKYHSLIDKTLPSVTYDSVVLQKEIDSLEKEISATNRSIEEATKKNSEIASHNTKVRMIAEELVELNKQKDIFDIEIAKLNAKYSNLQTLVKAFSPSGLVAYKIECLIKDLENLVNEYLSDMSDGRFQLTFKISATDKLDVIITDNGKDIDIFALSNGELARVNVSTLLAIRKLMQTLVDSRINLLILDETIESLDVEGKDKLVEVLLKEESLNTILISHGFTHPLLHKLEIVKENNISRIVE